MVVDPLAEGMAGEAAIATSRRRATPAPDGSQRKYKVRARWHAVCARCRPADRGVEAGPAGAVHALPPSPHRAALFSLRQPGVHVVFLSTRCCTSMPQPAAAADRLQVGKMAIRTRWFDDQIEAALGMPVSSERPALPLSSSFQQRPRVPACHALRANGLSVARVVTAELPTHPGARLRCPRCSARARLPARCGRALHRGLGRLRLVPSTGPRA